MAATFDGGSSTGRGRPALEAHDWAAGAASGGAMVQRVARRRLGARAREAPAAHSRCCNSCRDAKVRDPLARSGR